MADLQRLVSLGCRVLGEAEQGDVPTATVTAYLLDRACRTQLTAMSAGRWPTWSSPQESLSKWEHCYADEMLRGAWDYLVRRLAD